MRKLQPFAFQTLSKKHSVLASVVGLMFLLSSFGIVAAYNTILRPPDTAEIIRPQTNTSTYPKPSIEPSSTPIAVYTEVNTQDFASAVIPASPIPTPVVEIPRKVAVTFDCEDKPVYCYEDKVDELRSVCKELQVTLQEKADKQSCRDSVDSEFKKCVESCKKECSPFNPSTPPGTICYDGICLKSCSNDYSQCGGESESKTFSSLEDWRKELYKHCTDNE